MKRVTLLALSIVLLAGSAAAGEKEKRSPRSFSTLMFPLGGTPPRTLRDAPIELTRRLARHFRADVATVPIQDAAELLECNLPKTSCLEAIATNFNVERIIFGAIERERGVTTIDLTTFEEGATEKQQFVVEGATTSAVVEDLEHQLRDGDDDDAKPERLTVKPKKRPAPSQDSSSEAGPNGTITAGTWGIVVAGSVSLAVGGGLYLSAVKLSNDAAGLPTDTRQDIERLRAVERAGKTRVAIGSALMAVGGVVTTIGIVRAMVQRSSAPERPLIDVVPEAGGASVLFTKEWK